MLLLTVLAPWSPCWLNAPTLPPSQPSHASLPHHIAHWSHTSLVTIHPVPMVRNLYADPTAWSPIHFSSLGAAPLLACPDSPTSRMLQRLLISHITSVDYPVPAYINSSPPSSLSSRVAQASTPFVLLYSLLPL